MAGKIRPNQTLTDPTCLELRLRSTSPHTCVATSAASCAASRVSSSSHLRRRWCHRLRMHPMHLHLPPTRVAVIAPMPLAASAAQPIQLKRGPSGVLTDPTVLRSQWHRPLRGHGLDSTHPPQQALMELIYLCARLGHT